MAFKLDMDKLDKLTEDLKKLEMPKVFKGSAKEGDAAIPMFQCKGYLEKMGTKKKQWYKRFFVLRDSFLLSYNLQKSDFTVEPNKCIHLIKCKLEMLSQDKKDFCFAVTTQEKDRFLFAAETKKEQQSWRKDIEIGRIISHKNMVKLAVENQCLAETKNVANLVKQHSASALSIFSNQDYIKRTPLTGGAEGWLKTPGFCAQQGKAKPKKCYFMLKDSHILMFQNGDVLKKPRGVMYLVGTMVEEMASKDNEFKFTLKSSHCADFIELLASSEAQRKRWMSALKVGSRVTYGDFKLLLKEHELLQGLKEGDKSVPEPDLTPEQDIKEAEITAAIDADLVDDELEPGTAQPYDADGNPMLRNPEGKLIDKDGNEVDPKTTRFNAQGTQLDPFNRPLPDGAKPMFTGDGKAIGVGPDGKHYLPDGTEVAQNAPHFDADGAKLDVTTIQNANTVAETLDLQIKAREKMKGDGALKEEVDALGRTFRGPTDGETIVNADGEEVPAITARRIVNDQGKVVEGVAPKQEGKQGTLIIKVEDEDGAKEVGNCEINEHTTMRDVRLKIDGDMRKSYEQWVFLVNYIALNKSEEAEVLANNHLPEVYVRGVELKAMRTPKFSKSLKEHHNKQEEAKVAKNEFEEMMKKVRGGNFLKKVNPLGDD